MGATPCHQHARPTGLEHLFHPAEAYLTAGDNAAILSGTAYAAFPRPTGEDSHLFFISSGTSRHFRPVSVSCSHQFARPIPGFHGIKQRDYLGVAKFSPLPPPRTQRAPLRALRATQLAPWQGATGTAGNEVRTTRALARPVVQQAGSVLAHLGRTVLLPSQLFCPDRYSAGMPDVNIWESPSLLPVHYSVRGRSYSIEKPGHSRWGHTCSGKLPWGARID